MIRQAWETFSSSWARELPSNTLGQGGHSQPPECWFSEQLPISQKVWMVTAVVSTACLTGGLSANCRTTSIGALMWWVSMRKRADRELTQTYDTLTDHDNST